jgi:hypothetical protein
MAHHGSSIVALSPRWSMLRPCTYFHRNRTRVGASAPAVFQRARRAFPNADRRKLWYGFAIVLSVACLLCV